MIVLDTNVVSELMRAAPDRAVMAWVSSQPPPLLYTTSITQAEILYGLQILPAGRRRTQLEGAVEEMFEEDFAGRVLPFEEAAARGYARIAAERRRLGRADIQHFDAQIAAIAVSARAAIATGNVRDFDDCGLKIINPWKQASTPQCPPYNAAAVAGFLNCGRRASADDRSRDLRPSHSVSPEPRSRCGVPTSLQSPG